MKKLRLKRVLVGLAQHLLAAGAMLAVAGLLLNSYIEVESRDAVDKIIPIILKKLINDL